MPKKDLTGQRFGRLYVISKAEPTIIGNRYERCVWLCKCDCGNTKIVRTDHLLGEKIVSCGCYNKEIRTKHGLSNSKLYKVWSGMRQRCENHKTPCFKNYGGRGIKVCEEWSESFEIFYEWAMNNGYKEGLTLDRVDVNGNYEPNNCKWATRKEQSRNTRKTIYATVNNITKDLNTWADELGVSRETLYRRVHKLHWTPEEAVIGKHKNITQYTAYGMSKSLKEWAEYLDMNLSTLESRIYNGWSIEKAITTPINHKKARGKINESNNS